MSKHITDIVSKMTLEEKAGLCSGSGHWHTKTVERLGIGNIRMSDGPHGLRIQRVGGDHLGLKKSDPSTCFPTASAMACSFNREMVQKVGVALGEECLDEGVQVILGPGTNLKRTPLCGRNFEYFSEDPYLSSSMAFEYVKGVQSKGVATSLKHFAANNQENYRFLVDSVVDERTLRELYLAAFESVVTEAKPWTVMCAYNKLNGVYCSQDKYLLTDVLRKDWGFDGIVVSDWGAVDDRVLGLEAGLDLEMPPGHFEGDRQIIKAVKEGRLDEEVLNKSVERILKLVQRVQTAKDTTFKYDREEHHLFARAAHSESIVLLKNEEQILPLKDVQKIAIIGGFAQTPRFQGGGSSYVTPYKLEDVLEEIKKIGGDQREFSFAAGYNMDITRGRYSDSPFMSASDTPNEELIDEAVEVAMKADVAVIFAGLPESYETEGYDRKHLRIPEGHRLLIEKVAKVQVNTVVVLSNGSVIEMPWINQVKGVIEAYLGGQASGGAISDILLGRVNPSGKLAESFPKKLSDSPTYYEFLSERKTAKYNEGLFIGYRYFDAKEIEPLFPFGFGLSYTSFAYTKIEVDKKSMNDDETLTVSVTIKNSGAVKGKEVVQLYVSDPVCSVIRPKKELKGFEKVELLPGEEKVVSFKLNKRAFAYFDVDLKDWYVESGEFIIMVGSSSRDILLRESVAVFNTRRKQTIITRDSSFMECLQHKKVEPIIRPYLEGLKERFGIDEASPRGISFLEGAPLRNLISYSPTPVTTEELDEVIVKMNKAIL